MYFNDFFCIHMDTFVGASEDTAHSLSIGLSACFFSASKAYFRRQTINGGKIKMKKRGRYLGLTVFILLLALGNFSLGISSDSDEKVAIVCFLEGKAWLLEPGEKERSEIGLFDWIIIGAVIKTDSEAKLVLAFSNGDRFELGEKTQVTVGQNKFTSQIGSIKKLKPVPVMPQIASISKESRPGSRLSGIRLRGAKRVISGLYPSEGATVLVDKAMITFQPLEGVEKYRIEIEDEWGNNVFSVETISPRVTISPGIIKPAANYYWQVRTLEKDKPSTVSYAAFATVSEDHARIRNAFKAQVEKSKDVANLLLLAQMEMALGLRKETCETLEAALALFPDSAEIKKAMSQIECK
jgi:hypothetical protein